MRSPGRGVPVDPRPRFPDGCPRAPFLGRCLWGQRGFKCTFPTTSPSEEPVTAWPGVTGFLSSVLSSLPVAAADVLSLQRCCRAGFVFFSFFFFCVCVCVCAATPSSSRRRCGFFPRVLSICPGAWGWGSAHVTPVAGRPAHQALLVRRHLQEPQQTLEAMLRPKVTTLPGHIQAVYVQNVVKLYASILQQKEQAAEPEAAQDVTQLMVERLPQFVQSADLEVQERVSVSRGSASGRARVSRLWPAWPFPEGILEKSALRGSLPAPGMWAGSGPPRRGRPRWVLRGWTAARRGQVVRERTSGGCRPAREVSESSRLAAGSWVGWRVAGDRAACCGETGLARAAYSRRVGGSSGWPFLVPRGQRRALSYADLTEAFSAPASSPASGWEPHSSRVPGRSPQRTGSTAAPGASWKLPFRVVWVSEDSAVSACDSVLFGGPLQSLSPAD